MTETLVELIRHGEPQGGSMYRGNRIDHPLSEKGWTQMYEGVGNLAEWGRVISSPLIRCHAFATKLAEKHNIPLSVVDDFKEVGFGDWEGKTRDELKANNLQQYEDFYRDPINCRPPGAEPIDKFIARVNTSYQQQIQKYPGQHLLIVAHAGVMRAIIAHILHAESIGLYKLKIDNGGVTRIRHGQYGGVVEFINGKLP